MKGPQGVKQLKGVVQHYSWGGYSLIPELIGVENKLQEPFAEYWLGAHPNFPAALPNDPANDLGSLIQKDPDAALGALVKERFGSLPYLFKILDVRQMLSIQVHPDKISAEKGFEKENLLSIPRNAANRNYKDDNHKPELMVALTDFWLLHGFKKPEAIEAILKKTPELLFLLDVFKKEGYQKLYETVMFMDQEKVNSVFEPLLNRIVPLYEKDLLQKNDENFWAARAASVYSKNGQTDRGLFSIYLFNLLHLKKNEGIFQPAGLPHAYLEGANAEIMANSDNVLRAGLTDKYIDVAELMKHVKFEATEPAILKPRHSHHNVYAGRAEEFELHHFTISKDYKISLHAPSGEIILVMKGSVEMIENSSMITLRKGDSVFVMAGTEYLVRAGSETEFFRVCPASVTKN